MEDYSFRASRAKKTPRLCKFQIAFRQPCAGKGNTSDLLFVDLNGKIPEPKE